MSLHRRATDHRALVLEAVATCPTEPTEAQIVKDCADAEFTSKKVSAMIWQLRKEGLVGRRDNNMHFITTAGLEYLTIARFDRALPAPHERPRARRKKLPNK